MLIMGDSSARRLLWQKRECAGLCIYCGLVVPKENCKGCVRCLQRKVKVTSAFVKRRPDRVKLYRSSLRQEIITKYGGKCFCCGEDRCFFLTIDHINNDDGAERKLLFGCQSGNTQSWYLKLKREDIRPDLQVSCYNCNLGRANNGGVCPHVKAPQILGQDVKDLRYGKRVKKESSK